MRAAAVAGGWAYAVAIVVLSLTPSPPDPGFDYGDKLGHLLAYGMLMFWFCVLYRYRYTRLAYGIGWVLLGIALEFAQGATGYRSFELADMAANTLGVLAGALAALSLPRAARAAGRETP
ncbi:MAG: VanZ family protein [Proteobacteria bacterium]|nr:VanZ family protein [Pseudomonadota bacterium]